MLIAPPSLNAPARRHPPIPTTGSRPKREAGATLPQLLCLSGLGVLQMNRLIGMMFASALIVWLPCGCSTSPTIEVLATSPSRVSSELEQIAPYSAINAAVAEWVAELPPLDAAEPDSGGQSLQHMEIAPDGSWFWYSPPHFYEARKRLGEPDAVPDSLSGLTMLWRRDGQSWTRVPMPRYEVPKGIYSSSRIVVTKSGRAYRLDGGGLTDLGIAPGGTTCASPNGFIITVRPTDPTRIEADIVEVRRLTDDGRVDLIAESRLKWREEAWNWATFVWSEGGTSVVVCSKLRIDLPLGTMTPWTGATFRSGSSVPGGAAVTDRDDIVTLDSDAKLRVVAEFEPPNTGRHFVYTASPSGRQAVIKRPTAGFLGSDVNAYWRVEVRPGMGFPTMSGERIGHPSDQWFTVARPPAVPDGAAPKSSSTPALKP